MNKNILLVLAVIVTLLTAWLVISLASVQSGVIVTPPTNQPANVEGSQPSTIEMSVQVGNGELSTTVEVQ